MLGASPLTQFGWALDGDKWIAWLHLVHRLMSIMHVPVEGAHFLFVFPSNPFMPISVNTINVVRGQSLFREGKFWEQTKYSFRVSAKWCSIYMFLVQCFRLSAWFVDLIILLSDFRVYKITYSLVGQSDGVLSCLSWPFSSKNTTADCVNMFNFYPLQRRPYPKYPSIERSNLETRWVHISYSFRKQKTKRFTYPCMPLPPRQLL